MNNKYFTIGYMRSLLIIFPVLISALFFHLSNIPVINRCEIETCPFCYGEDFCNEFKDNISLNFYSFFPFVFNLISVKNVYFGRHGDNSVVIKKLAHNEDFEVLNQDVLKFANVKIENKHLIELLNKDAGKFKFCDSDTSEKFLKRFIHKNLTHLWTLLKVNMEPLLLELFPQKDNWPVPKLLGYCGRTIVVENCGIPLSELTTFNWYDRVYVAFQLLTAAESFTLDHEVFRLYLLDISPDNIVVTPNDLKVSFVDLEHVVLQKKIVPERTHHYTHHIGDEDYAFSTEKICSSHVSDHNIYAVCRLLLSQHAPWPMMNNGLLHSSPRALDIEELIIDIDNCVNSVNATSRFYYSKKIKEFLRLLLKGKQYKV